MRWMRTALRLHVTLRLALPVLGLPITRVPDQSWLTEGRLLLSVSRPLLHLRMTLLSAMWVLSIAMRLRRLPSVTGLLRIRLLPVTLRLHVVRRVAMDRMLLRPVLGRRRCRCRRRMLVRRGGGAA